MSVKRISSCLVAGADDANGLRSVVDPTVGFGLDATAAVAGRAGGLRKIEI